MLQTFTRSIGDCPSNCAFTRHDVWNVVWNTSTSCPELRRTLESPSVSWRGVAFAKSWNHRGTLFISSSVQKKTFFLIIPRCLHVNNTCFSCHYVVYRLISLPKQMFLPAMIYVCVSSKQKSNEVNWRHWQWFEDVIWFSMPGRIQGGILL